MLVMRAGVPKLRIDELTFSPDGASILAPAGASGVCCWSPITAKTKAEVLTLPAKVVKRLAFSPDGHTLYAGSDQPGAYYYTFRRGPLGVLVLDTGEDKPDDHPVYGGLNDFAAFRTKQAEWLAGAIEAPAFKGARFKVLFCHIPLCWIREKETGSFCGDGRKKWHDLLVRAGVQLVISGHTHEPAWMPAEKGRPYGQLIAGGPKPTAATYIRGRATADGLTVTQYKLSGEVQYTAKLG